MAIDKSNARISDIHEANSDQILVPIYKLDISFWFSTRYHGVIDWI